MPQFPGCSWLMSKLKSKDKPKTSKFKVASDDDSQKGSKEDPPRLIPEGEEPANEKRINGDKPQPQRPQPTSIHRSKERKRDEGSDIAEQYDPEPWFSSRPPSTQKSQAPQMSPDLTVTLKRLEDYIIAVNEKVDHLLRTSVLPPNSSAEPNPIPDASSTSTEEANNNQMHVDPPKSSPPPADSEPSKDSKNNTQASPSHDQGHHDDPVNLQFLAGLELPDDLKDLAKLNPSLEARLDRFYQISRIQTAFNNHLNFQVDSRPRPTDVEPKSILKNTSAMKEHFRTGPSQWKPYIIERMTTSDIKHVLRDLNERLILDPTPPPTTARIPRDSLTDLRACASLPRKLDYDHNHLPVSNPDLITQLQGEALPLQKHSSGYLFQEDEISFSALPNLDNFNGGVLLFGGSNQKMPHGPGNRGRSVHMYTRETDKWIRVGILPRPRTHFGLARVEDYVYLIGGIDPQAKGNKDTCVSTVFRLDLRSGDWEATRKLNSKRSHFGCVAVGHRIYIIGGIVDGKESASCIAYDTTSDTFDPIAYLDIGRANMGAAEYCNCVMIAGGTTSDPNRPVLETVTCYDPAQNRWTPWTSLPSPRAFSSLVVSREKVYLVGGTGVRDMIQGDSSFADVLCYNDETNEWEEVGMISTPRHGHTAVAMGNNDLHNIIVIGGVSAQTMGALDSVEIFSPSTGLASSVKSMSLNKSGMAAIAL